MTPVHTPAQARKLQRLHDAARKARTAYTGSSAPLTSPVLAGLFGAWEEAEAAFMDYLVSLTKQEAKRK